jgi:phosphatidylglycerophosphatase A
MMLATALITTVGIKLGNKFENVYGKDPSQFTLDELAGTWISLILVPKTILFLGVTFFIWRLLDILKPFPARLSEKLKGGWGIMMDDIISGFYTLILVHIIIYFFK